MLAAGTIARKILRSHAIAKKIRTLRPGIPSPRVLHNPAPSQNIMPGGNTGLRLPAPRQAQPSFRGEMALCRGLAPGKCHI